MRTMTTTRNPVYKVEATMPRGVATEAAADRLLSAVPGSATEGPSPEDGHMLFVFDVETDEMHDAGTKATMVLRQVSAPSPRSVEIQRVRD